MDRIMVSFRGDGAGTGELTWGQAGLWQGMSDTMSLTVPAVTALPPGLTVDDVADSLGFVIGRHQALRTLLRLRPDGPPSQVCVAEGEVPLEIQDAEDGDDPAELATAVRLRYQTVPFDYEHEFPIRMAVIRRNGAAVHLVVVYLHTAVDAGGLAALVADIAARDPLTGAAAGPVTARQPIEQARRQAGASERRQSAASLAYQEQVLRTMPASQLGEPRYPDEGTRSIRHRSPATALAIRRAAAQETTSTSSVLLTAFAVAVARFTGNATVMLLLLVSNRFRPGFADSVSPVVELSPYLVDVGGVSLREAVGRTNGSVFNAYKHAYYDPYEQDVMVARVQADRGLLDYNYHYNDRRDDRTPAVGAPATDEELAAAVGSAEYRERTTPDPAAERLSVTVSDVPGAVEFEIIADSRFLSAEDLRTLVTDIELVALRIATAPTLPTGVAARAPSLGVSATSGTR